MEINMDIVFLLGRILFAGFFIMSGIKHLVNHGAMTAYAKSKGAPMAGIAVTVSGLMILLGGIGVLLTIYYSTSLVLIALFLLVVSPQMHAFWKETDPQIKEMEKINFSKNVALLGASLILLS